MTCNWRLTTGWIGTAMDDIYDARLLFSQKPGSGNQAFTISEWNS
jgi:hypothetical protein